MPVAELVPVAVPVTKLAPVLVKTLVPIAELITVTVTVEVTVAVPVAHTSKKRKKWRGLFVSPKKLAEKVRKSRRQDFATKGH